jgi:hypothetical protein
MVFYSSPVTIACIMHQILCCIEQEFFLWQIFATWRQKKRAGESNKWIFENFLKKIAISREKKLSRQI